MEPLSLTTILLLWAGGLCAGFVDSIAGGGGMIAVPVLLTAGLPPLHLALGTNKLQSSFGSFTAAVNYAACKGLVRPRDMVWGIGATATGAILGTLVIQQVAATVLNYLIPVTSTPPRPFSTPFSALNSDTLTNPRAWENWAFNLPTGLLLGFYDGFFGPGTGPSGPWPLSCSWAST